MCKSWVRPDHTKELGDDWGLALCREDVELHRTLAPYYPLRRIYRRLCHDPSIPFFPPRFSVVLFIVVMSHVVMHGGGTVALSLMQWTIFFLMIFVFSVFAGVVFDLFLLPIAVLIGVSLEGLCIGIDMFVSNPWIWWQGKKNNKI